MTESLYPSHASAPLELLVVTAPQRACAACGMAKDEVLSRDPWAIGFRCSDCRAKGRMYGFVGGAR